MTETVSIHGRQYETVASRVHKFRKTHSIDEDWGIDTEVLFHDDKRIVVQAKIISPSGRVVASGVAEERRDASTINRTSALENGETSAMGRALAAADYHGTEYCTADELTSALGQQKGLDSEG